MQRQRTHPTTWLLLLCAAVLAAVTACASAPVRNQLELGYATVDAAVAGIRNRVLRGATTKEQATRDLDRVALVKQRLDSVREAYERCAALQAPAAASAPPATRSPCVDVAQLMQGLQPDLLTLERELRAKEQGK